MWFSLLSYCLVGCVMVQFTASIDPASAENFEAYRKNMTISHEKRLTSFLRGNYDIIGRGGRPVRNASEPLEVKFGLGLIQLDLDEKSKVLTTSMWARMNWIDAYLTWNPGDFGGIFTARLYVDDMWLPDIALYNTADPGHDSRGTQVVITPDGSSTWVQHEIFRSSCSIDVTNFPFDEQKCTMWFGSWTHLQREIDLSMFFPGGIDLSTFNADYKDSNEWDVTDVKAEKMVLPEGDPNPITILSFTMKLQRKMVFSSYILTLPCVFLASLTLVVFCLPPERPDRTGLGMSLFSSFLVLLLILVEAAPPTASSVPKIGLYYCFNMVLIMVSIFLSTLVVSVHRCGNKSLPMPRWVHVIFFDILSTMLCMRRYPLSCLSKKKGKKHETGSEEDARAIILRSCTEEDNIPEIHIHPLNGLLNKSNDESFERLRYFEQYFVQIQHCINEMKVGLNYIIRNMQDTKASQGQAFIVRGQWEHGARILDRLFFILYFVTIVISLVTLFPRPKLL